MLNILTKADPILLIKAQSMLSDNWEQ